MLVIPENIVTVDDAIRRGLHELRDVLPVPPTELPYVRTLAETGKPAYKGLGATAPQHFRHMKLRQDVSGLDSVDAAYADRLSGGLTIGGRYSRQVIESEIPFYVAGMSFGSLKLPMKIAIHLAANRLAQEHGIHLIVNTGEGGALPWEIYGKPEHWDAITHNNLQKMYEFVGELLTAYHINFDSSQAQREFIKRMLFNREYPLVVQAASGRFWKDPNYLKNADGIEVKIGQGAKIGHGGLLPGPKVDENVAYIRGIPPWNDARSPARQLHILGPEDLVSYVLELREITDWKVPIIVKVGASHVYNDMKIILKSVADAGAVDGLTGGTGAAPVKVQNVIGISTEPAIVEARRAIDDFFRDTGRYDGNFKFLASGGTLDWEHMLKARLLGADGIGMGTSFMLATGCTLVMTCNTNMCPAGITGSPEKFNMYEGAEQIVKYVVAAAKKFREVAQSGPKLDSLVTNNDFVSAFSGIKLSDGRTYRDVVSENARKIVERMQIND